MFGSKDGAKSGGAALTALTTSMRNDRLALSPSASVAVSV